MREPRDVTGLYFGRYQLLMKMAAGGMATLYLARLRGPEKFERLLCIKKVHDHLAEQKRFTNMFLDECRIAALIHHSNVASVYDMGEMSGAYYMALEYVHGHDLRELLAAAQRLPDTLPWTYAARIVASAAAGLHAAHELKRPGEAALGVVHRDVSHQNILISYDGAVKVVDFGVAYAKERISNTGAQTIKGKLAYMSPEQAELKPLDRRSDVFSLGVVLFEAVTLMRLFKAETEVETIMRVRRAKVPNPSSLRPDIPARLEKIILRALAKNPDHRFQTAAQLQGALEALLVEEGQVVGQQQIADLMERLFHTRREEKDARIATVVNGRPPTKVPVIDMGTVEEDSLTLLPDEPTETWFQRHRRMVLVTASALGGVALALVLGILLLTGRPASELTGAGTEPSAHLAATRLPPVKRPAPVTRPAPAAQPAPMVEAAKPTTVNLRVEVVPAKAAVRLRFRGRTYTGATFQAQLKRSDRGETVKIEARGYASQSVHVVPLEDRTFQVKLAKKKRLRRRWRRSKKRQQIRWKPITN